MRKLTKVIPALAVVVTMGSLMIVVQASPAPPVRVPVTVMQNGARTPAPGSPFWGSTLWGSDMYTSMKVLDNQGGLYGLGNVHESYYGLSIKPACPADLAHDLSIGAAALNDYGRLGTWDPNAGTIVNGIFTDHNFSLSNGPLTSPTANTGNDQWVTATQHWHIRDSTGRYALPAGIIPSGRNQLDLNTNFLDYRQTYYIRTPGF